MFKNVRTLFVTICFLGAAACGPLPVYYKPGVEVSRQDNDTLRCQTQALKDAPVANEIRQRPPIYYPGGQYCTGGNCYYRPGYWVDGGVYTVDVNQSLRQRLEQSCMAEKGYQQVSVKRCTQEQIRAIEAAPNKQPELGGSSCALRNKDGTTRIVNVP